MAPASPCPSLTPGPRRSHGRVRSPSPATLSPRAVPYRACLPTWLGLAATPGARRRRWVSARAPRLGWVAGRRASAHTPAIPHPRTIVALRRRPPPPPGPAAVRPSQEPIPVTRRNGTTPPSNAVAAGINAGATRRHDRAVAVRVAKDPVCLALPCERPPVPMPTSLAASRGPSAQVATRSATDDGRGAPLDGTGFCFFCPMDA